MPYHLPESSSLASILAEQCLHRQEGPPVKMVDHLETNPLTMKPDTATRVAAQSSWVPSPACTPPRCDSPIKTSALAAGVSAQAIHFRGLDKSPLLGPLH